MDFIKNIEEFLSKNAELFIEVKEIGFSPDKWEYVLGWLDMYGFSNNLVKSNKFADCFELNTNYGIIFLYKSHF